MESNNKIIATPNQTSFPRITVADQMEGDASGVHHKLQLFPSKIWHGSGRWRRSRMIRQLSPGTQARQIMCDIFPHAGNDSQGFLFASQGCSGSSG